MSKEITVSIRKMDDLLWRRMSCDAKMRGVTISEYIQDLIKDELLNVKEANEQEDISNEE